MEDMDASSHGEHAACSATTAERNARDFFRRLFSFQSDKKAEMWIRKKNKQR